jgi:hypothetical protein
VDVPAVLRQDVAVAAVEQHAPPAQDAEEEAPLVAARAHARDRVLAPQRVGGGATGAEIHRADRSVDARGGDAMISRDREARHGVFPRADALDRVDAVGPHVPELDRAIVPGGDDDLIVRGEGYRVDGGVVPAETSNLLPRRDVPQKHLLVAPARGHLRVVSRARHVPDLVRVPGVRLDQRALERVPEPKRSIFAARQEVRAADAEGDSIQKQFTGQLKGDAIKC